MRLSDAEWTVMNAVWDDAPASARDVLERVQDETGWAYTTVKTMLSRLEEKGAVSATLRGNTSYYEPLLTRGEARHSAIHSLLDRAFEGAFGSLIQHVVTEEKLSRRDRRKLAAMLEKLDGKDSR